MFTAGQQGHHHYFFIVKPDATALQSHSLPLTFYSSHSHNNSLLINIVYLSNTDNSHMKGLIHLYPYMLTFTKCMSTLYERRQLLNTHCFIHFTVLCDFISLEFTSLTKLLRRTTFFKRWRNLKGGSFLSYQKS